MKCACWFYTCDCRHLSPLCKKRSFDHLLLRYAWHKTKAVAPRNVVHSKNTKTRWSKNVSKGNMRITGPRFRKGGAAQIMESTSLPWEKAQLWQIDAIQALRARPLSTLLFKASDSGGNEAKLGPSRLENESPLHESRSNLIIPILLDLKESCHNFLSKVQDIQTTYKNIDRTSSLSVCRTLGVTSA